MFVRQGKFKVRQSHSRVKFKSRYAACRSVTTVRMGSGIGLWISFEFSFCDLIKRAGVKVTYTLIHTQSESTLYRCTCERVVYAVSMNGV